MTAVSSMPLWLTDARRTTIARHLAAGEPTARAIVARAEQVVAADAEDTVRGERAIAHAVLAIATGETSHAAAASDAFLALIDSDDGNLGRANVALIGSAIHDACYAQWDDTRRLAINRALFVLCRGFRVVDLKHGDPHVVTNNHWAVGHAGAAMAAMAIHGLPGAASGASYDMTEDIAWAVGRVKPFFMHHGDHGLYHEGLGYQLYPAAFWLPCLLAVRNVLGTDWLAEYPSLRQAAASLYASVAARQRDGGLICDLVQPFVFPCEPQAFSGWAGGSVPRPLVTRSRGTEPAGHLGLQRIADAPCEGRVGIKLSWNDDGDDWCNRNSSVLLLAVAPQEQVGALRWMYDRLNGIRGDGLFNPDHAGLFFSLLYYPYDVPACDPNGILPTHVTDSRQGLRLFRNRYQDGDDAVVGAYARVTHVGGHAHDDAGSVRCMALGHDWIVGGGQGRGQAEYQSVVTAVDSPRATPFGCGAVIADEASPKGGVFGIDLRRPTISYAERWVAVDFGGAGGSVVTLAMLDVIDDHLTRDWHWNLSFGADLTASLHADGAGFDLVAADGATGTVRFLGPRPANLALRRMPDSKRTFQGGNTVVYPGGPFVQARFPHAKHTAIYAVMTLARRAPPRPELGDGLDVRLDAHIWRRPFGAAIPAAFDPNRGGTLCRYPGGELAG